jgi:hypothetical protein
MSEQQSNPKRVRLLRVGEGDPELQALIEKGLNELGHEYVVDSVEGDPEAVLGTLNDAEIPLVLKPSA